MSRKARRLKPFFEAGYKVQTNPNGGYPWLEGRTLTITRIEELPDPTFLDIQSQEEWEDHLRIRWFNIWVKVDDCTELPEYFKEHEIVFREGVLRPIPPRMNRQNLAQYCQQCLLEERDEQRREAYLQVLRYLQKQQLSYPLSSLDIFIPRGQEVDLINQCIRWAVRLRKVAQELGGTASDNPYVARYEAQAQVFDELSHTLLPGQQVLAPLV